MTPSSIADEKCRPSLVHSNFVHLHCPGAVDEALQSRSPDRALLPVRGTGAVLRKPYGTALVERHQGRACFSNSPADANVNALAGTANVMGVSFGPTHRDLPGWKGSHARAVPGSGAMLIDPRGSVLPRDQERRVRILALHVRPPRLRSLQPYHRIACTMFWRARVPCRIAALELRRTGVPRAAGRCKIKGSEQAHA